MNNLEATTSAIQDGTKDIKEDTSRIISEIQKLRVTIRTIPAPQGQFQARIEEYLDSITTYAETVYDDIVWSEDEEDKNFELARSSVQSSSSEDGQQIPSSQLRTKPLPVGFAMILEEASPLTPLNLPAECC